MSVASAGCSEAPAAGPWEPRKGARRRRCIALAGLWRRALVALRSRQTYLVLFLLAVGALAQNRQMVFERCAEGSSDQEPVPGPIEARYGAVCFAAAALTAARALAELLISHAAMYLMRRRDSTRTAFSIAHSVSPHLSVFLVLASLACAISLCGCNGVVAASPFIAMSFSQIVTVCAVGTLLLALLHVLVERIKHSFNDAAHLNRVLRCLYLELFLGIVEMGSSEEETARRHVAKRMSEILPHRCPSDAGAASVQDEGDVPAATKKLIVHEFHKNEYFGPQCSRKDLRDLGLLRARLAKRLGACTSPLFDGEQVHLSRVLDLSGDRETLRAMLAHAGIDAAAPLTAGGLADLGVRALAERADAEESFRQRYSALKNMETVAKLVVLFFCAASLFFGFRIRDRSVLSFTSAVFGMAYIVQPAITDLVDGLIFLFFVHPFDIGDRVSVEIDDVPENMVVLETHILYTVFQRWDNMRIYVCNKNISSEMICNFRRGRGVMDTQQVQIAHDTSEESIEAFKAALEAFLHENQACFTDLYLVNYVFIEKTNKLHLRILTQLKDGKQDYGAFLAARSRLLEFAVECLQTLGISYLVPTRTVRVARTPTSADRTQAAHQT